MLMVAHALSVVRHSHGNTSTVHGTNSRAVYESLSSGLLSSHSEAGVPRGDSFVALLQISADQSGGKCRIHFGLN